MGKAQGRTLGWERRQTILKYLRANGSASIAEIGAHAKASPATIHRDLEVLVESGHIERVHGGALSLETMDDPPASAERHKRVAEKQAIADEALTRVSSDINSIFLEASTTVTHLVPALRALKDKIYLTNSPEIALDLGAGNADVVLIGGNLRHRTLSTVGPLANEALRSVHIDLAFIGVSAMNAEGLSSMNAIEAETKSILIGAASNVIALGDGEKLGKQALVFVAGVEEITELITDNAAPSEEINALRRKGLKVTVAGEE